MRICTRYDAKVDAALIFFNRKSARTEILDENRLIHYDRYGAVAFVELPEVSKGVKLDGLPQRERIERRS